MAFSLFGKKPPAPGPAIKRPAKPAARDAASAPAASEEELASLDFTLPGQLPGNRTAKLEVEEVTNQVPPAIEQAAMLYSVEQGAEACGVLEAAIREGRLNRFTQRAWGMLFELYQHLGRQQEFEALALKYAAEFETSPPAWNAAGAEEAAHAPAPVGRPGVSLSGVLTVKAQDALQQLLRLAEKSSAVRLDLAKVTDADEPGCALLADTLRRLKKTRKELVLAGADKLAALLAKKIVPGQQEREQAWLLLLELYQELFAQQAFEDTAVNYAVTFEVSPPSWEPPKAPPPGTGPEPAGEPGTGGDECVLLGEMISVDPGVFAPIRSRAEGNDEVVVDASRLRRMDFVSAAHLMNLATELAAARKKVRFVKTNHLVAALWEVIGLDRVARIETRKA